MLKFFYNLAPNPMKVALLLEELGLPYEAIPVDTRKGEQHTAAFKAVNPNAKVPAIDDDGVVMFDSNAILLWLADKHARFVATDLASAERAETLSWLMFIASGIGPYSGQAVHFRVAAPEPKDYALNRYDFEADRHWKILDERLATRTWLVGDSYGIVDMALWGWARLLDSINARPAAARVEALRQRHSFKTEMDDEARRAMFPQNERLNKA
jgi:GST-like protein